MLPLVSQVLRKVLSPISEPQASSPTTAQVVAQKTKEQGKKNENSENQHPHQPPKTPSSTKNPSAGPKLRLVEQPPDPSPPVRDMPALIQIFAMVKSHRDSMLRWAGVKSYKSTRQEQKKTIAVVKGAILDHKGE